MAAKDTKCDVCGEDPCGCGDQDDDCGEYHVYGAQKEPASLKRSNAFIESSQPPSEEDIDMDSDPEVLAHNDNYQKKFKQALLCSEQYNQEPDLDVYFDDFHLSAQQRIAICRTYANYLTQKLRASGKMAAARTTNNRRKQ